MIHFEKDNNGITQHMEGNGETLLTELMVAINAFKEEGNKQLRITYKTA